MVGLLWVVKSSGDDAWRCRRLNVDRAGQPTQRRLLLVWSRRIKAAEARRQIDWRRLLAFILRRKMQVFVISKSTNSCCFIFQFASSTMHSRESSILLLGAEHVDVIGRCLLVCRDRSPIYTTLQYRILVSSKYCFLPSRCGCSCANAILLISCGVFRTSNAVILRRYLEVCPGVSSYLHVLTCRCDVPDFCSFFDWLLRTFHCTRHLRALT